MFIFIFYFMFKMFFPTPKNRNKKIIPGKID